MNQVVSGSRYGYVSQLENIEPTFPVLLLYIRLWSVTMIQKTGNYIYILKQNTPNYNHMQIKTLITS